MDRLPADTPASVFKVSYSAAKQTFGFTNLQCRFTVAEMRSVNANIIKTNEESVSMLTNIQIKGLVAK